LDANTSFMYDNPACEYMIYGLKPGFTHICCEGTASSIPGNNVFVLLFDDDRLGGRARSCPQSSFFGACDTRFFPCFERRIYAARREAHQIE
jgi:hypothetical protein